MNIVKLKDIVMPETSWMAEFFNKNLKGKYAYWVQMRYIFPLNSLDFKNYIKYEQLDTVQFLGPEILPHIDLYSEEACMYEFAQNYIDHDATEIANTVADYRTANEYVADEDIDINKLRRFRSWLANELLMFNTSVDGGYLDNYDANQIHMLEYYKNDMYNEVVKQLSIFGVEDIFSLISGNKTNTCCACNTSNLYTLTNTMTCNALDIYNTNVHNLMVQTFEDVNFWMQFNKDFIGVFKRYIDNIIKTGLVINVSPIDAINIQCNCSNSAVSTSNEILKRLSESLQYIIDDEVKGHLNYIHDALYDWADLLYDKMSWEIK